ncbi:MAG: S8 family peptidase, partial [Actinomycetota bacterium]|nr:S8 family peptidase [Actinomycetota bacterium]
MAYEDIASETSSEPPEEAAVEVELPEIGAEVVGLSSVSSEKEVRKKKLASLKRKLERKPNVASVEYNYERRISYTANDPGLGDQWGLGKASFEWAWNGERGEGAKIAVLDTGISAGHPDIRGKISAQRDFLEGDQSADDTHGHCTTVAGIAAARTDNGTGIAGACPDCQLLVGKVMDGDGIGYDSDIAQAITWSVDSGADVVNLFLGGTADSTISKQAVDYAADKGVVVVAAMGNQGTNSPEYPAAYPSVVAVASTDRGDERAYNSNFGEWVDVAAPGVEIASTVPGGYSVWSGTSMAAPHVSAEAALLSASGMNSGSIKSRISKTAQDLGFGGRDPYYGAGRIDAGSLARTDNPPKPVKTAAAPASKNLAKNAQTSR